MRKLVSITLVLAMLLSFTFPVLAAIDESGSIIEDLTAGLNYDQYPRLVDVYKDYFLIGAAGDENAPGAENPHDCMVSPRDKLIAYHYNSFSFENTMKPENFVNNPGGPQHTIDAVKPLTSKYGFDNEITFYGHTLLWHSQSPSWLWDGPNAPYNAEVAKTNMKNHIEAVITRYGSELSAIDVVNEALLAGGSTWRTAANANQGWALALGADFLELAFQYTADVVDRLGLDVTLYYNDFGIEGTTGKAKYVYDMVKELNEKNKDYRKDPVTGEPNGKLLIGGVGIQGHYGSGTSASSVEQAIKNYGSLGVKVSITELDVAYTVTNPTGFLTKEQAIQQAHKYAELFQVFKKYAAGSANPVEANRIVERITFWGTNDGNSWIGGRRPLLFNPIDNDGKITGKEALLGVLDPDWYRENVDLPVVNTIRIDGVQVFDAGAGDEFSGANIILGNTASVWPWSTANIRRAFHPQPGVTYKLKVEYIVKGAGGIEARWISDNGNSFTAADIANLPETTLAASETADGIPARFRHDTVNSGTATMTADFSIPDDAKPGDLTGNIAIRGLDGDDGIEITKIIVTRGTTTLVNWPSQVTVTNTLPRGAQGYNVGGAVSGTWAPGGGGANIVVGKGINQWPYARANSNGEVAFNPEPDATYRLSFNVTPYGTDAWRIRWTPDANRSETYTTADVPVVNNHNRDLPSGIGYGFVNDRDTIIAEKLPTLFYSADSVAPAPTTGQAFTLVSEITFSANEVYNGLIGNIALRGLFGGSSYNINWIKVEKLEGGQGSEIEEVLSFWPYGLDNLEPNFAAEYYDKPTTLIGKAIISRQDGIAIDEENPLRSGETLVGTLASPNSQTALSPLGDLIYTWKSDEGILQQGSADTFVLTSEHVNKAITLEITSSFEIGVVSSDTTASIDKEYTLMLSTDAHLVNKGDYFHIYPKFTKVVKSNTAILNFKFDTDKFEFRGFTPGEGVQNISAEATEDGAKIVVMVMDYNTKDYGEVLLSAKEDADLENTDNDVSVFVDFVVLNDEDGKQVHSASANTSFTSVTPPPPDGYNLIDLSNIIDIFGKTKDDDNWSTYRFYDFDGDGEITIRDISTLANRIM